MKGRIYLALLTVVAFLLIVVSVPAPIIIPPAGGGGTISGSITGAYSFNGPFSVVNATNVYLSAVLSNQVVTGISPIATNFYLTPTIYTNVVYINATGATPRINGLLLTNIAYKTPAGTTIIPSPGTYWIPTNEASIVKNGVNWHLNPGVTIISGTTGDASDFFHLINDSAGAITSSITGSGVFVVSNDLANVINLTNENSKLYVEFKTIKSENDQAAVLQDAQGGQLVLFSPEDGIYSQGYDALINQCVNNNVSRLFVNVRNLIGDTNAGDSAVEVAFKFKNPGDAVIIAQNARGDVTFSDNMIVELGNLDLGTVNVIYSPLSQTGGGVFRNTYVYGTSNRTVSLIQTPSDSGLFATAGTFDNNTFVGPTNRPVALITNDTGRTYFNGGRFFDGFGATNSIRSKNAQSVGLNNVKLDLGLHANISSIGLTNHSSAMRVGKLQNIGTTTNAGALDQTAIATFYQGIDVAGDLNANGQLNATLLTATGEAILAGGLELANGITISRALMISASGDVTNVPPPAIAGDFLRTDGTSASPSNALTASYGSMAITNGALPGSLAILPTNTTGAFVMTVDKDLATATTNSFSLSGAATHNLMKIHSVSGGNLVWTNAPLPFQIPIVSSPGSIGTNLAYHIGGNANLSAVTDLSYDAGRTRMLRAPATGRFIAAHMIMFANDDDTCGSAEAITYRITNITQATSALIGTTASSNQVRMVSNRAMTFAVNSNDLFMVMVVTPIAWTNAPLASSIGFNGSLTLE